MHARCCFAGGYKSSGIGRDKGECEWGRAPLPPCPPPPLLLLDAALHLLPSLTSCPSSLLRPLNTDALEAYTQTKAIYQRLEADQPWL